MLTKNTRGPSGVAQSVPELFEMYAVRPTNEIYHLVTRSGHDTLCGLRVSRIASDRTGNRLQLIPELPTEKTICKHCERIRNQELID